MFKPQRKRTTPKKRSQGKSVSPLNSEERKLFQENIPVKILTASMETITVDDVDVLKVTLEKGISEIRESGAGKEEDSPACAAQNAHLKFGSSLLQETDELKQDTSEAQQVLDTSMKTFTDGPEKRFFLTAVNSIKTTVLNTINSVQATEVEVYDAPVSACPSKLKKYLRNAWSAISFISKWALNISVWIFNNPAMVQFLVYLLKLYRNQLCEWLSMKLGYIAIENPKSLFEKFQGAKPGIMEFVTRTVLVPLMATFFAPGGYFENAWDMLSGNFSGVMSKMSGTFLGPLTQGLDAVKGFLGPVANLAGGVVGFATSGLVSMQSVITGAVKTAIQSSMNGLIQYYAFSTVIEDLKTIFWIPGCIQSVKIEINSPVYLEYVKEGYITQEQDKKYQDQVDKHKEKYFTLFDIILF